MILAVAAVLTFLLLAVAGIVWAVRRDETRHSTKKRIAGSGADDGGIAYAGSSDDSGCNAGDGSSADCGGGGGGD